MKKFVNSWVAMVMAVMFLVSCGATQTPEAAAETVVTGYEMIPSTLFASTVIYCQTREKNGTLSGDALVKAKGAYAMAAETFIKAGDPLSGYIDGSFPPSALSLLPTLLNQLAVILANLSGGPLTGQFKPAKYVPTSSEIKLLHMKMKAGLTLSPAEIEMAIGLVIMIAEYIASKIKGNPAFTDEQKAALKNRIKVAQQAVPVWN
jgi:hypothetical protein